LSSATISSVGARVFCIALYFKLRRGFWGSCPSLGSISSVSDKESQSRAYFW